MDVSIFNVKCDNTLEFSASYENEDKVCGKSLERLYNKFYNYDFSKKGDDLITYNLESNAKLSLNSEAKISSELTDYSANLVLLKDVEVEKMKDIVIGEDDGIESLTDNEVNLIDEEENSTNSLYAAIAGGLLIGSGALYYFNHHDSHDDHYTVL